MHMPIFFISRTPNKKKYSESDMSTEFYDSLEFYGRRSIDYINFNSCRDMDIEIFFKEEMKMEIQKLANTHEYKVKFDEKFFRTWINKTLQENINPKRIDKTGDLLATYRNVKNTYYSYDEPVILEKTRYYDSFLDFFCDEWGGPKDGEYLYVQAYDCHC